MNRSEQEWHDQELDRAVVKDTTADFDALLARRDDLQRQHDTACAILEEEGPRHAHINHRKCVRLYDELVAVQARIDAELEAERASDA